MLTLPRHACGFFSCCSVKLCSIIHYYNHYKTLPEVNSANFYVLYQTTKDITFDFFKHYQDNHLFIGYDYDLFIDRNCYQFTDYRKVNYNRILPFVERYFSPSDEILQTQLMLKQAYKISPENTIGVYYRGTDKKIETTIDSFESYYYKIKDILQKDSSMQILIQSDTTDFIAYMKERFSNAIIILENDTSSSEAGIHNEKSQEQNYKDMKYLFPTFLILSECKHLVCGSSNGSIWMMFYRKGTRNVHQNLNQDWLSEVF